MEIVKRHPELGYKMVIQMDIPKIVAEIAHNHHEKINEQDTLAIKRKSGSVYDQIVSIIDVYDALISDRPYKKAISFHHAINILFIEGKTSFNPALLHKFVEIVYNKILK